MKTHLISFVFLSFVLSLNQVNSSAYNSLISYGETALPGERPYQVFLTDGSQQCGGVIISKNWIITAAHCLGNPNYYQYTIRAGSIDKNYGGSVHYAKEVKIHPNYYNPKNDIALIRVTPSFQFDYYNINSIEMFEEYEPTPSNVVAILSGWGLKELGQEPNKLEKANVPILPKSKCKRILQNKIGSSLGPGMFCAGYEFEYVNSCIGDSGGPLTVDNRLVGIVSWGTKRCGAVHANEAAIPNVYTEISYFRRWIRSVTGV